MAPLFINLGGGMRKAPTNPLKITDQNYDLVVFTTGDVQDIARCYTGRDLDAKELSQISRQLRSYWTWGLYHLIDECFDC